MPHRRGLIVFRSAITTLLLSATLFAQDIGNDKTILDRLDRLEQQNRQLIEEIKSLRAQVLAKNDKPSDPAASEVATERQEVTERRVEEIAQTKVESSQKYPIQLTGMALFNAYSNGPFNNNAQNPTRASLEANNRNSGASFRQTVLGVTFRNPQSFVGATVSGSVYMDFFGGSGQTLNQLMRLRLATVQMDWPNTTFAVGIDKPLVSRREPNSYAQVGVSPLTAAGNPWLWQPQARIEQRFQLTNQTSLKAEAGVFQTSETSNQTPAVINVAAASRPALQLRVSMKRKFGEERLIEVAPVLHASTSQIAGQSIASRLYGIDWLVKPFSKFEVTGMLFRGQNFANLGALGGISLRPNSRAVGIRGIGGWTQFRYLATSKLSFDLYGGQQDDDNRDVLAGSISKNQYYAANAIYLLAPNLVSSFEFGQARTTYLGIGKRLNNHYDLAIAYLF